MDNDEINALFNKIDNLKRHPLYKYMKIQDQLPITDIGKNSCWDLIFKKQNKDILKLTDLQHHQTSMKASEMKGADSQTVIRMNATSNVLTNQTSSQTTEMNSELRIIIIDENWSQYCYRIKINTPFGKLINRFCQQVRKADNKSVLFWYHGRCVEDDDTPRTLNIKDNEVILAHYIK
ncbi:hypothetical protein HUG17_10677 [Dermatophagoides farinae]|uniref:Rad60/SUMO-like domain-containing protein n=1 Tax=Dermatophagoides farinae TaxID=6954 RepID=A0A9D4NY70_DERFA|nr:uncharacterized protein LOC124500196 [Dermatophagoides farinae]KAH7640197.1 hypothetical protein HUG17_10677 [Dermatophagoides farinae]